MSIPVVTEGTAPGVQTGGRLVMKMPRLNIKSLPKDMPESINVDISKLELSKTIKVGDLAPQKYDVLTSSLVSICSVDVPRALKSEDEEQQDVENAENAENAEED